MAPETGLFGIQEPRVLFRPLFDSEATADEALDLARSAGVFLDPWQEFCVRLTLAETAAGNLAAIEVAMLVARQNGKGEVLLVLTLCWLFITSPKVDRLIMHTAHEFKTASEAFLRLQAVIDGNDFLSRRVLQVWTSHGEEGYKLRNGKRLRFIARSRSSGRGFTGDKVIVDEAQQVPTKAMDALIPTLSARPMPLVVYTGTVPEEGDDSEHWTRLRDRGRARKGKRLAWAEFNHGERLPLAAKYMGSDEALQAEREALMVELIRHGNPALGYRMNWDFIETERETLSYLGFIRERLNIWSSDPVDMVIDMDTWDLMEDPASKMVGRRAIAVDCPPKTPSTAIGAMGRRMDGHWHAEILEQHPGTAWVPVRVAEIVRKNEDVAACVIDPASPAGALIPAIKAEGVEVLEVSQRQHGQACGMLYARAYEKNPEDESPRPSLHHLGDDILTDALRVATQRPGPEGTWLWNRRDSGDDISPLVAVTLAGFGLSTLPDEEVDPWAFWS